jgi:hypothetical protein
MDSRIFVGVKAVAIYVTLEDSKPYVHKLLVIANSRRDLAFTPDSLDFGKIKQGDTPTKKLVVTVTGQPEIKVTKATCANKSVEIQVRELSRNKDNVQFEISVTIRKDIPVGVLNSDVELTTNNAAMPRIVVPLRGLVEAAK